MIIELVGLPGSGKTTVAEAMRAKGAVSVPLPPRARLLFDAGAFWFLRPVFAVQLLWSIMTRCPRGIRYELFINGYLGYAARYREARALSRSGAIVVLDQGFSQLSVSLGELPAMLLTELPRPDLLVVVAADVSTREARMALRGWAPREGLGPQNRLIWQQKAEKALENLLAVRGESVQVYPYDGAQNPHEGAAALMELAALQASMSTRIPRMRSVLKTTAALFSFLVALVARIFRRAPQVVVLMYHAIDSSGWKLSVTPEMFERQMRYLARKGWAVSLADVVAYAKGEKRLSTRAVSVTFDDGYRDLLTTVLPILERHHIPATVFVPSDTSASTGPYGKARLTEEEIKALARSPFITIGSHAKTHRKFTELTPEEMKKEAEDSAETLARISGTRPRFFAYPFGTRTAEAERTVRDSGYEAAFSISEGCVHPRDDVFRLKRVQVDGTMNFFLFCLRLTAAVDWNRRIVDFLRRSY